MKSKINITPYQPKFLEQHVELGKRLTKSWKYFGQTSLPVMRQQYNAPEFNGETRLYAINEETDELVGFHTADITESGFARVEFPIVDEQYPELMEQMYEEQLKILKKKGVETIQSRVSIFWGKTKEYADKYNYQHVRDLYYVTDLRPENLLFNPEVEILINLVPYDKKFEKQVKNILINYFDTSEQLAQSYIDNYDKSTGMGLNHYLENKEGKIIGRVTFASYEVDDKRMALSTIYVKEGHEKIISQLVKYIANYVKNEKTYFDEIECYVSGTDLQNLSSFINTKSLEPVISFYTREI